LKLLILASILITISVFGLQESQATTCNEFGSIFKENRGQVALKATVLSSNIVILDPPLQTFDGKFSQKLVSEFKIDKQIYGEPIFDLEKITVEEFPPIEPYEIGEQKILLQYFENVDQKWYPFSCNPAFDMEYGDYNNWIVDLQKKPDFDYAFDKHSFENYLETINELKSESLGQETWKEILVVDKLGYYIDGQERTYRIPYYMSEGNLDKIETNEFFEIFLSDINKESIFKIKIPRNYPVTNMMGIDRNTNFFVLIHGEETTNYTNNITECYNEISIPLSTNFEHIQIDWGHVVSGQHIYFGEKVSEDCIKKTIVFPLESFERSTIRSTYGNYVFMKDQFGYNISYEIVNGTLTDVIFDCSSSSMYLEVSPKSQGILNIEVPRELLKANVLHGLDDYEFPIWDKKGNFTFIFQNDSKKLGFMGTEILDAHKLETGKPCKPIHNPPYSYILSPIKQIKNGVATEEMRCKDHLVLVPRNDDSGACVKQESFPKLIERGWFKLADALDRAGSFPEPNLP